MALTRLRLDFSLQTNAERADFLNTYLQSDIFKQRPPTDEELEMMGNYLLWGKDPVTGLNAQQDGSVEIETRHKTWDKNSNIESLEGLMESPTFNEASLRPLSSVPLKVKREVFDRKEALRECPDYLRPSFETLFEQIDDLDMCICLWELAHNKRKNPPRAELAKKFDETAVAQMQERTSHWNQFKYLKMRHQLVELRREAYTLRDSYRQVVLAQNSASFFETMPEPTMDVEIEVLPLGLNFGPKSLVFEKWENLVPARFGDETVLKHISDLLWKKKAYAPGPNQRWIDFRDLEHVYEMFQIFFELENEAALAEFESNLPALMKTLEFYVEQADLTDLQREILDMKIKKVKNTDIAAEVNRKWNKSYTPNYISTIFRQRIIPKINEAAAYHEKIVENLFFEEEFKVCSGCGRTLLRDTENFTRKSRSQDGFTSRCKKCEKEARERAKGDSK